MDASGFLLCNLTLKPRDRTLSPITATSSVVLGRVVGEAGMPSLITWDEMKSSLYINGASVCRMSDLSVRNH